MTEQEAMIRLDFIRCALLGGTKPEIIPNEDNVELMDNAIKALEDVEQYRKIGTVEECRAAVEKIREIYEVVNEWDKVGYSYSNNHMCEIKMIVKGGGI